jgi:hypothetical protein
MRSASRLLTSSVLTLLVLGPFVWAQTSTTSLHGTVLDPSGAAVPKATVTVRNPAQAIERTTKTISEGTYGDGQCDPRGWYCGRNGRGYS